MTDVTDRDHEPHPDAAALAATQTDASTDAAVADDTAPPVASPDRRVTIALVLSLIGLIALLGGWPLLLVIGSLVVMIILHELGHYIAAKKSGMKVTEFFLGFGPKLWSFQRGETEYGVKAIPAGAYVRIIGMHNLDEVPPEDEPRTYRQQSYPKRLAVAIAGSTMHFLQAAIAIFLVFTVFGAPGGHLFTHVDDFRIKDTVAGSAAQQAGIQPGDRILSIDGQSTSSFDQLHSVVSSRAGKQVAIVIDRNGQQVVTSTTIGSSDGAGFLGVEQQPPASERVSPIIAVGRTASEMGHVTKETFGFFGAFFSPSGISHFASTVVNAGDQSTNNGSSAATGPASSGSSTVDTDRPISIIGATRIGTEIVQDGAFAFLAFFASINLMIGIFNMIPLLPLDGGHVAIATYERIRSRKGRPYHADVMKMMPVAYAVVMVLVLLGAATIFLDIVNPITLH